MKYRILEIPTAIPDEPYYQAQFKFLNLIWMNCGFNDGHPNLGYSCSMHLENVEKFIESKLASEKPIKVIKTYE